MRDATLFKKGAACSTCPLGYNCCEAGLCVGATPAVLNGSFTWDQRCAGQPKSYTLNVCENGPHGHQIVTMMPEERSWIVRVTVYSDSTCTAGKQPFSVQQVGVCDSKIGYNNKFTYEGSDATATAPDALTDGNCATAPAAAPPDAATTPPTPGSGSPPASALPTPAPPTPAPPTPAPPTPVPTQAPTPAPAGKAGCESFISPSNFGFFTGGWTGSACNQNPVLPACAVKHVAKYHDGTYVAGIQQGRYYKMCKFYGDGERVPYSGRYRTGSGPASASDLKLFYLQTTKKSGEGYQFKKGTAFSCRVPIQAKADCGSFVSPSNFGFFTGSWTGRKCNRNPMPAACAVRNVAKDSDGKYIAGFQQGVYYKMCKFNGDGTKVTSSGRYKSTWTGPASASELKNMYRSRWARKSGSGYEFLKGSAFSCLS